MTFPFTTEDFLAAYKRLKTVKPIQGTWMRDDYEQINGDITPGYACPLSALYMARRTTRAARAHAALRLDDAVNENAVHENNYESIVRLINHGLTESQLTAFTPGYDSNGKNSFSSLSDVQDIVADPVRHEAWLEGKKVWITLRKKYGEIRID